MTDTPKPLDGLSFDPPDEPLTFPWEEDNRVTEDPAPAACARLDPHEGDECSAPAYDDVVDAEIVDEPQPDALAVVLANDTRDVTLSYRDPDAVATFAIGLRRAIREDVRATMHRAARERIDAGKPSAEAYAAEWQLAADVAETLTTVADAIKAGVEVVEDHAAMLLDDVTDPAKRTRSVRVGDGHGRDLKVGMTQGSALSVDRDAILDLIIAEVREEQHTNPLDAARFALDFLLGLVSGPSWKSSALDVWKRSLEGAGRHAEAITLGHAYGRVDKGEPRLKIERVDPPKRGAK